MDRVSGGVGYPGVSGIQEEGHLGAGHLGGQDIGGIGYLVGCRVSGGVGYPGVFGIQEEGYLGVEYPEGRV